VLTPGLAASLGVEITLNDLLSVPASAEASHSLLLTPEGNPWKPWREPTHLTLGSLR
jgi:hypothetical protein